MAIIDAIASLFGGAGAAGGAAAGAGAAGAGIAGAEAGIGTAAGSAITPTFSSMAGGASAGAGLSPGIAAGASSITPAMESLGTAPSMMQQLQGYAQDYGKIKALTSGSNPNSGLMQGSQGNQGPMFSQMMQMAMQHQQQQKPQMQVDHGNLPWTSMASQPQVQRQQPAQSQMGLDQLMGMLSQKAPDITDTGGSGPGGSSGGLVKNILSLIGGK